MDWAWSSYEYPSVVEIAEPKEPLLPDDFGQEDAVEAVTLGPRLISHTESQLAYYEKQKQQAVKDLARVTLIYSGQLQFDFPEQGDGKA